MIEMNKYELEAEARRVRDRYFMKQGEHYVLEVKVCGAFVIYLTNEFNDKLTLTDIALAINLADNTDSELYGVTYEGDVYEVTRELYTNYIENELKRLNNLKM